jgi:putative chitinase
MFADIVYANVNGNGDAASGDGYRYRGRGLIQLTGRDQYAAFGRAIGRTPEEAAAYCATTEGAALSGCWYLSSNGCLPLADAWDIDAITRRVNGDAMEAAGLRRQYSDEMVSRLRGFGTEAA